AGAGVDADVVDGRTEEDEVAGLNLGQGDRRAGLGLVLGHPGEFDAMAGEDVLHEAGAVEPVRGLAAPAVGNALVGEGGVDDSAAGGGGPRPGREGVAGGQAAEPGARKAAEPAGAEGPVEAVGEAGAPRRAG